MHNKVILIGGTPGAGKTTLGSAVAAKLGITSLTIDDLVTAAVAVTSPETHPGLHVMRKTNHLDYYTNSSVEQLKADATLRHQATWPMVEQVIHKYVNLNSGIVIDGWHLRPNWIADLQLSNVQSYWIVVSREVLETRERKQTAFFQGSSNPDRMFQNFLARSLWYNDLIKAQATELQMHVLYQTGDKSVDQLCRIITGEQM